LNAAELSEVALSTASLFWREKAGVPETSTVFSSFKTMRIALQIAQEGSSQAMNFEQNEMAVRSKVVQANL
jgi:hypothetical protein